MAAAAAAPELGADDRDHLDAFLAQDGESATRRAEPGTDCHARERIEEQEPDQSAPRAPDVPPANAPDLTSGIA